MLRIINGCLEAPKLAERDPLSQIRGKKEVFTYL